MDEKQESDHVMRETWRLFGFAHYNIFQKCADISADSSSFCLGMGHYSKRPSMATFLPNKICRQVSIRSHKHVSKPADSTHQSVSANFRASVFPVSFCCEISLFREVDYSISSTPTDYDSHILTRYVLHYFYTYIETIFCDTCNLHQ